MRSVLGLILASVVFLAVPATRAEDPVGWLSIGGNAGLSGFKLGDVNRRITGAGNEFLQDPTRAWTPMDEIRSGWTFWADAKIPVPMTRSFFLSGGYGVSSGSSGGKDYNELITVKARQKAYHARVLYVIPWRFNRNVRLFAGGGPLIIREQSVEASHTHRSSAGGSQQTQTSREERVRYVASGLGWTVGAAAEYMIQDRLSLSVDVGYRLANLDYSDWTSQSDVTISETGGTGGVEFTDGTTSGERLSLNNSYVGHAFLDWDGTRLEAEANQDVVFVPQSGGQPEAGPYVGYLKPLAPADIGIDLSGFQLQIGLRLYIF
jgi:hypothetical protein